MTFSRRDGRKTRFKKKVKNKQKDGDFGPKYGLNHHFSFVRGKNLRKLYMYISILLILPRGGEHM